MDVNTQYWKKPTYGNNRHTISIFTNNFSNTNRIGLLSIEMKTLLIFRFDKGLNFENKKNFHREFENLKKYHFKNYTSIWSES